MDTKVGLSGMIAQSHWHVTLCQSFSSEVNLSEIPHALMALMYTWYREEPSN